MPAIKKETSEKDSGNAIINANVKNYANDPYFVKKAEEAKKTLSKVGLPEIKKTTI